MKRSCRGSLLLLAVINMLSCIRETDLVTEEGPFVAVECILTDSNVQTLKLCYSRETLNGTTSLNDAEAYLYDESASLYVGSFEYSGDGIWTLNYRPESGHKYKLEIKVPGYELIVAEQVMPEIDVKAVFYIPIFGDSGKYEYDSYPLIVYEMASFPEFTWIYAMDYDDSSGDYVLVDNLCTDLQCVDNFNLTGTVYTPQVDTVFQPDGVFYKALYWPLRGLSMHNHYLRIPHPDREDKKWMILSGDMEGPFQYEQELTNQWRFVKIGRAHV